ncbi:phosphotransferase [Congregibacter litoralis]|uniref:Phosphotransferase enzyme family n=1 Tax=Congregibacter litoralis KT71 TaxID=314285 RepID=A4A5I9_9GAMM|nr:phosphotransferase [Congregibacter litoralis]EAQ99060.2 Phosphotransferase enzyme family [Congregibacter litoralis KT71]
MATEPASSTAQLIDDLCGNFAVWAPELAAPPTPGAVLAGGCNHYLQILESPRQVWVARIARNALRTSEQRTLEASVHSEAAGAGIAPEVRYCDPRRGITIMEYLEPDDSDAESPEEIAKLFGKIHALPLQGEVLHSPDAFRRCRKDAAGDTALETLLQHGAEAIDRAVKFLEDHESSDLKMCHNDLLGANRLRSRGHLFALDWEYAASGDPFFDLAVCASQMTSNNARALLKAYLQREPMDEEKQRFAAQSLLYACVEACWYSANAAHGPETQASLDRLATHSHGDALL